MNEYIIKGQHIYAQEAGTPHSQVALLIHGWSSSSYALTPLMPLLSKRFHCIAVDLPGYGDSPLGTESVSMAEYADLLAELIRSVSDRPVVLVGHSMGGMISLTLAIRHPDLVERMVLISPTISGRLSTSVNLFVSPITMLERFSLGDKLVSLLEPQFLSVTDRLMRPVSFAARSQISEEEYTHLRSDARRPGQGRVRAECFRAMRAGDLRGQLSQIKAPALVLWGAEDNTVPLRDASVVADEWPAANLRIIPCAGHWPQFETPDVTLQHMSTFLNVSAVSSKPDTIDAQNMPQMSQMAQFLAHSDVGNGLDSVQCIRLASQCRIRSYRPYALIAQADDPGDALFIVQDGDILVESNSSNSPYAAQSGQMTTLQAGQITGELSLLEGRRRTTNLYAGPEGATLLRLTREQLDRLCEEDPTLSNRLLWNIATALALRLRLISRQRDGRNWGNVEPLYERVVGQAA